MNPLHSSSFTPSGCAPIVAAETSRLCVPRRLGEGGHLRSLLQKRPFSEAEVLKLMSQLLSAVATLHSNGIMHRDIKLDNLVLVPRPGGDLSGCLRLTDFGTADFFQTRERRPFHGCFGTLQYMAPEVLERNKRYGPEADVFSCGVAMFFLLTGRVRHALACSMHVTPEASAATAEFAFPMAASSASPLPCPSSKRT